MVFKGGFPIKQSVAKQFFSFFYGSFFAAILGFLVTIIATRILEPSDLGKASLIILVINIASIIISFGTDRSFIRFFHEEAEEKRGGLLYQNLRIPLTLLLVFSAIIIVFYKEITKYAINEISLNIAFVIIIGTIAQLLYRYGTVVLRMKQRGNTYSFVQISEKLTLVVCLFLFYLLLGKNYKIYIYATMLSFLITSLISISLEKEIWNFRNFRIKGLNHSQKEIIVYSLPLLVTTMINWLFESFDKISINHWSTFEELGLYTASYKIVGLLVILQTAFSTFWTPLSYQKFNEAPNDKAFFEDIIDLVAFVSIIISIFTIAFKDLIVLFLGSDYKNASNIMPFLVFIPMLRTISEASVIGINFKKKTYWHIFISLLACLVNILGNAILVPKIGAIGAATSTAFAYVVFYSLNSYISNKLYSLRYRRKTIYLFLIVISIYSYLSIYTLRMQENIILGILVSVMVSIIYKKQMKMISMFLFNSTKKLIFK